MKHLNDIINQQNVDIDLLNVVEYGDYQYEQEIPLGVASIAAFLRKYNYDAIIHQVFTKKGKDICLPFTIKSDVFGIQLNMVNYNQVKTVVKRIKEQKPNSYIILGGPFIVTLSEKILQNEPLFDAIVLGEGEYTILEFLQTISTNNTDFSHIKGLIWRSKSGNIVKNELRKPIENLDELPFPARDFLENSKKDPIDGNVVESIRFITSRGCIGKCSFCCVNLFNKYFKGKRWRGRSPKNVVNELEILVKKYKARLFNFSDSSFEDPGNYGKQRAKEICEEIIRRKLSLSIKVYMRCETMKSHEDIKLLKLYKKAGIDVIIVGAEAGSDYELKFYEKRATIEDNFRTIRLLRELDKFYVLVGFIMFGPNSTKDTLLRNLYYLQKCGLADNLMQLANVLILIRGSKLYFRLRDENRLIESNNYWFPPKYTFIDPLGERMSKHWSNLYSRFQNTKDVNTLQVNLGNLIYRMTNPMNNNILDSLYEDYLELKKSYSNISRIVGDANADYFKETLWMVEKDCSEEQLTGLADKFFEKQYGEYKKIYSKLYNNFLKKVQKNGFGLSGLVFKHFYSAIAIDGTERV